MNKVKIFMDYDGTVVSNQKRLYRFFVDHLPEGYKDILTVDEFWNFKVLGIHEVDWINKHFALGLDKLDWDSRKSKYIEEMKYLKYNELFWYAIPTLEKLALNFDLVLVTRRSNQKNLFQEIENNGVSKYFTEIIVIQHQGNVCKSVKVLEKYNISSHDIFVGDTEDDMKAGLKLGIKTYFVKSGIRREWILKKYFTNELSSKINIIENISQLQ
ncbi:HAD family hydrolase [Paenibacillus bouchesdurhonensis]|uniref:HAD family hydrolase n=1 Tax=Paenibacillus bouchesdurhonensis TaxID=1870990 RepID=UPI000DA63417|nr:HAD hydrolase-like protein [Paenibacillus bouchesdurhonensis]